MIFEVCECTIVVQSYISLTIHLTFCKAVHQQVLFVASLKEHVMSCPTKFVLLCTGIMGHPRFLHERMLSQAGSPLLMLSQNRYCATEAICRCCPVWTSVVA